MGPQSERRSPMSGRLTPGAGVSSGAGGSGIGLNGPGAHHSSSASGDWYVFDDTAVRLKPADEVDTMVQCEGYHVCFLMYRREDTKTINIRPHVV